jgi:HEAT repeat protein
MPSNFAKMLRGWIEQADLNTRADIERDITRILERGIKSLRQLIDLAIDSDQDLELRLIAYWLIGKFRSKQALSALILGSEDGSAFIRRQTADALKYSEPKEALPPLLKLLSDENSEVRKASAHSLGLVGSAAALPMLLTIAENQTEETEVRGMAVEALGSLGDVTSLPILIRLLADPSPDIRFWAVFALGELRDTRAIPYLESISLNDTAMTEFGAIDKEAIEAINQINRHAKE